MYVTFSRQVQPCLRHYDVVLFEGVRISASLNLDALHNTLTSIQGISDLVYIITVYCNFARQVFYHRKLNSSGICYWKMTSLLTNETYRCEQCQELQRSLVKTLGEKRALLLRLQKEQARIRKLLREAEKGRKRDGEV